MKSSAVFWGYEDLVLFGGALIPSIVLGVIAGWLVHRLFGLEKSIEAFVLQFVAYACWFGALYLIFRLRYEKPFWESLSWRAPMPFWPAASSRVWRSRRPLSLFPPSSISHRLIRPCRSC
jgi:hypothetical protein